MHRNSLSFGRLSPLLLLLLLLLGAGGISLPVRAQAIVVLEEKEYVALPELGGRLDLTGSWTTPGKNFVLSGRATRVEFTTGSREVRVNGTRIFLGEPTVLHRRQLHVGRVDYEATLQPLLLAHSRAPARTVRTIVIDPGHGGRDSGTRNKPRQLQEKNLTLEVAHRLKAILEQQGYGVAMTRSDDTFIELAERSALANAWGADLFVSIHFNAVDNPAVEGTETYILTPQSHRSTGQGTAAASDATANQGNEHDHWNMLLGFLVHRQLLRDLASFDRGLKRARFQVLRGIDCPALLVEAGYLSNSAEAARITTADYQNQLARSLAISINRYRQATESIAAARK